MSDSSERQPGHQGRVIRSEIEAPVSPWQAWLAWSDLGHLANWLFESVEGEVAEGQTLRGLLTGNLRCVEMLVRRIQGERSILAELKSSGQLIEVSIDGSAGSSLVSITHSGFSDSDTGDVDYIAAVQQWQLRANILKLYLASYFGRSRRTLRMSEFLSISAPEVQRFILDPAGHRKWWVLQGRLVPLRESLLKLWDGTEIHSRVLVANADSLLFTWVEGGGYVLLTCHPVNAGTNEVGIDISSWNGEVQRHKDFAETLRVGLSKLRRSSEQDVSSQGG